MENIEEVEGRLKLVKDDDTEEGWDIKNAQYSESIAAVKDAFVTLDPPCSEEVIVAADNAETVAQAAVSSLGKGRMQESDRDVGGDTT